MPECDEYAPFIDYVSGSIDIYSVFVLSVGSSVVQIAIVVQCSHPAPIIPTALYFHSVLRVEMPVLAFSFSLQSII